MILRRSVLRATDALLDEWPPPEPDAVPDAALLRPGLRDLERQVVKLRAFGVECIFDGDPGELTYEVAHLIRSVAARATAPGDVDRLARQLDEVESRENLSVGLGIELLVEDAAAVLAVREAASRSARVLSVAADPALLASDLCTGDASEVDPLAFARGETLLAAALARCVPIGRFEARAHHRGGAPAGGASAYSFAMGFRGALCDEWGAVVEANRHFVPSPSAVGRAQRIVREMADALTRGLGAISIDGRMIDIPFIQPSEALIAISNAAQARREAIAGMMQAER